MNEFSKNNLYELNEDGYLLWKNFNHTFVSFNLIALRLTENDIIDSLKDFINVGGIISISFDCDAKLRLTLDAPSHYIDNSIYLTEIPIEFYNRLNDININRTMLYNGIQYGKQVLKVYEKLSDEEKLKIELDG